MSIKSFKGGVHPPEKKAVAPDLPVVKVFPSTNQVRIPVTQGGAPNEVLVKVGDKVARGQKIAASDKFMSAPVHSSVSGTVKKIENHLVVGNKDALCIVIQCDEEEREEFLPVLDPFTCTHDEALARIREAGIAGMGGASFPAHVKLSPPKDAKIEYVLGNGAECEPYLCTDAATIYHHAADVVDGMAIVMRITNAEKGVVVLEENKKDLVPVLQKAIDNLKDKPVGAGAYDISVQLCKTKYPQGGEKTLTTAVLNREIPSGGLPFQIGCVIQNIGTLRAISEAFRLGKPLIDRPFTISGGACENPQNVVAPIGTSIGDLIPSVITLKEGIVKIISGGPMMGFSMKNANFPVQKNTSGVLFLTEPEVTLAEETDCINCGKCIGVCSCKLSPVLIVRALNRGDLKEATRCGLLDCVECGTCSFTCPARIQLVQRFKVGKMMVREAKMKEQAKQEAKKAKEEVAG
ncbi:MAG: electron transport complex subunit RsxC [Treponema sp.]|nr:MAG: electron transport complex subunit RsxC [Treponema sp.]